VLHPRQSRACRFEASKWRRRVAAAKHFDGMLKDGSCLGNLRPLEVWSYCGLIWSYCISFCGRWGVWTCTVIVKVN
jgi:hypothetical protein